jgi:hypothetical protein
MHHSRIVLAVLAVLAVFAGGCPPAPIMNHALLLDTGQFATTDFDLSKIAGKSHSISFRVMLRYSNSYFNDMIGEGGTGNYDIVKTASASGQCNDPPALAINIGSTFAAIQNPHDPTHGFQTGVWYTVIVTVDGSLQLKAFAYQTASQLDLQLAVRIGSQWYRYSLDGSRDPGDGHCGRTAYKVTRLSQVKRQVFELRVDYTGANNSCDHAGNGHGRSWGWDERGVVVIGVGPSGKPSGMPQLVTQLTAWERSDDSPKRTSRAGLTVTWAPTGELDVGGKAPDAMPSQLDSESLLGHHLLTFP